MPRVQVRARRRGSRPASQITLMTSSSDASTRPRLNTRLVRRASHRCARYSTIRGDDREHERDDHVGSPVAWPLAAAERVVLLGEDGVGGGQQHQVRLFGGDLQERAAGQRVADRVLGSSPRRRSRCRRTARRRAWRGALAVGLAPPAACSRGQVAAGGRDVSLVALQRGQRRLGTGQEHRGDGHVGVRDRLVHLPGVEAERLVGRARASAAEECRVATQPPNAPQASESRTSPTSSARSAVGVFRRRGGGLRGRRAGRPVRGGAGRGGGSVAVMSRSPRSAARPASPGRRAAAGSPGCPGRTAGCRW